MNAQRSRRSHGRIILICMLIIGLGAMVAPLAGYLYVNIAVAQEQQTPVAAPAGDTWQEVNPRSEYWRAVRNNTSGYTTSNNPGADTLMQATGQDWREVRNGLVATWGGWFLALVVLGLGLFYVLRGPIKLKEERSGRTVTRWSKTERNLHWATAILFIIMAITGLSLLFGRAVLMPLLGTAGFAAWAGFSKILHNYTGLLFTVCILLMIVTWIRYNLPRREDWAWIRNAGGMFGKHAPSGRVNAGEKAWFWFIAIAGALVCITGLVMDFPNIGYDRSTWQITNVIHAVLALGWIGFLFGHIYIGTLGTEGALEGMTTGDVSVEWAKQHHDLWYEEITSGKQEEAVQAKDTATKQPSGSV